MGRHRLTALVVSAVVLVGASCANRDDSNPAATTPSPSDTAATADTTPADTTPADTTPTDTAPGDTTPDGTEPPATDPPGAMFGTMPSPCGPGNATIADGQNGGDTLKLGTATDHGYEAAPGLTIEMLDAAKAFAGWCNEQGGIQGLPIEIVDLDGKLFNVPPAIETACAEVFAMVGGGWTFDEGMFPRFHECGMINFAGFTVTAAAAMGNGKVQPIPNPANLKPASWLIWARDNRPEEIQNTAIMYGDFITTEVVARQIEATMEAVGGYNVTTRIPTNPAGEPNWAPFAEQLKQEGITALVVVGAPATLVPLYKSMREIGYVPDLVFNDANFYDQVMVADGTAELSDGFIVRTAYAPFEEADQFPGMRSYLDMMETYNPEGRIAGLGLQSTSAFLLFATAANACLAKNDGVLERECVLAEGKAITSWTGGGLHTETNPGSNEPPSCGIMMQVRDGRWQRLYPELGSADDNGGGGTATTRASSRSRATSETPPSASIPTDRTEAPT